MKNTHHDLPHIKFPEICLEYVENEANEAVALMEYFRDYKELPYDRKNIPLELFTLDEKAFLTIYNLWVGNYDFKTEHVLISPDKKDSMAGLIDLEKSFDFNNVSRLPETAQKSVFLEDPQLLQSKLDVYIKFLQSFVKDQQVHLVSLALESQFNKEEAQHLINHLMERAQVLKDELETVYDLLKVRGMIKNISTEDRFWQIMKTKVF